MNQIATFFNAMAEQWDTICKHNPDKIQLILQLADLPEKASVLDVGCGTGILEPYLLSYFPRQLTAIDIAPQMIEKAQCKYTDNSYIPDFRCMDIMDLHDEQFDFIFIYSAYPHFLQPEHLFRHLSGLLNPGGKLIICHSDSKEKINNHHKKHLREELSLDLPPAQDVAALMKPYFKVPVIIDTEKLYMVIGQLN